MKAKRLERAGAIIRLKRGLYILNPEISGAELSPFLIANHIYGPSYVSMQTALRHYGLIPEAVYAVQSMTTGIAHKYTNALGTFTYLHTDTDYFNIGVTIATEAGAAFMTATPEKALCDLMIHTPKLNIKSLSALSDYLEYDIRFDMDELANLDTSIIEACAAVSRKKVMLNQLVKFITHARNL